MTGSAAQRLPADPAYPYRSPHDALPVPSAVELRNLQRQMGEAKDHLGAWARRVVSARKELGSR